MIKQSTTACAVSDLEKYHAALDKALLRYHGLKIGEINKIIRELWVSLSTIARSNIVSSVPNPTTQTSVSDTDLQRTRYYQHPDRFWSG
jgi:hypothetical protein